MSASGLEHPGVLDALAHDTRANKVVLAMYETRLWEGEKQLFQLQEKLNAYLSFVLDGEMGEAFPQLRELPVEIQLRTAFEPSGAAWDLIRRMREQLEFQKIAFVVTQVEDNSCRPGCGCAG